MYVGQSNEEMHYRYEAVSFSVLIATTVMACSFVVGNVSTVESIAAASGEAFFPSVVVFSDNSSLLSAILPPSNSGKSPLSSNDCTRNATKEHSYSSLVKVHSLKVLSVLSYCTHRKGINFATFANNLLSTKIKT